MEMESHVIKKEKRNFRVYPIFVLWYRVLWYEERNIDKEKLFFLL